MSDWTLNRLYHTVVNCRDIDESVAFYKLLGFEVLHDRRDGVAEYSRHLWPEARPGEGRAGGAADGTRRDVDLIEWVERRWSLRSRQMSR
jgi:catechol 2,3-dioxygenase-like lactoylglutathione lyase family enzyme